MDIGRTRNLLDAHWMLVGTAIHRKTPDDHHHKLIPSIQKAFLTDVRNVVNVLNGHGNPFADQTTELFTLNTNIIMSGEIIQTIWTIEDLCKRKYQRITEERLCQDNNNRTVIDFEESIPKNNLPLFKSAMKKPFTKAKTKMINMKSDRLLFSRMYISCQARGADLDNFFQHENHTWPPSLAENNIMHQGNKADLIKCLEDLVPHHIDTPQVDAKIIDGSGLVHTCVGFT